VPPRDPEALCDQLDTVLRDSERSLLMGRAGRARVLRSFTWQQVAMCTAQLYDDLLCERFALSSACRPILSRGGSTVKRQPHTQTQGV